MLGRTDYSATQRRRATIFRPATAAAHLTYDRHISERQSLNTIFTRVNPSIRINCVQRAVVLSPLTRRLQLFLPELIAHCQGDEEGVLGGLYQCLQCHLIVLGAVAV